MKLLIIIACKKKGIDECGIIPNLISRTLYTATFQLCKTIDDKKCILKKFKKGKKGQ